MSKQIYEFLIRRYPEASKVFRAVGVVPKLRPRSMPLPEAVVRVVVGQMLSSASAKTIYGRLVNTARDQNLQGTWQLDELSIRNCGISRTKTRTITEFGLALERNPNLLDDWVRLPAEETMSRIKSFWGMSNWTASILALSYLAHEDIFPHTDGSLVRAINLIERRFSPKKFKFDPIHAAPYRSYLAIYLWKALDGGHI
jgi:DNA-3-methyladenine glycosylase II